MKRIQTVKVEPVVYQYEKGPVVKYVVNMFLKVVNQKRKLCTEEEVFTSINHLISLRERQIKFGEPRFEHYPTILADLLIAMQPISAPELFLVHEVSNIDDSLETYDNFVHACKLGRLEITDQWPPYGNYSSIGLLGLYYKEEDDTILVSPSVNVSDDDIKKKMWINYPSLTLYGEPVYEVLDQVDLRNEANSLFYRRTQS